MNVVLVFVKAPRPGAVKTRLAASIGAELAADLYRAMAEHVLGAMAPPAAEYERIVVFTPEDARAEMEAWLPGVPCVPQEGADLGARMAAATAWAFAQGATAAIVVGTDAPELSRQQVAAAFESLERADVAIGPAADGGYYLIGLRRSAPALFERIAWSTPDVLALTLARAEELGLMVAPLPLLADIDTVEDLRRAWPRLQDWLPQGLLRRLQSAVAPRNDGD
jgi:rSAM/selenodomain-associated transferase 1